MSSQAAVCSAQDAKSSDQIHFDQARSLNQQINQLEKTNNNAVLNSRPLKLGFDISNVCNANCIFCLAEGSRRQKKDINAFRPPSWLDNFEPLLPFIELGIFSSFEAMLNPDFDQFVMKMRKFYTPFQIFTNGKALTPEMSEFILRNGLHSIHCSFHSPDPGTYESIMRGLSFDENLGNLMRLKMLARKYNPDFNLVMVFCAMRRNITQLLDYVELAHRVGARRIQVNYLMVTDPKHKLEKECMYFNQDEYDSYVSTAKVKAAKLGINLTHQPIFQTFKMNTDELPPCYRPWEHLNVSQEGDATICCGGSGALGNIFKEDFFKVWNSKQFTAFRKTVNSPNPPAACKVCTRGREDPTAITSHITYLSGMPKEKREQRIKELCEAYG